MKAFIFFTLKAGCPPIVGLCINLFLQLNVKSALLIWTPEWLSSRGNIANWFDAILTFPSSIGAFQVPSLIFKFLAIKSTDDLTS